MCTISAAVEWWHDRQEKPFNEALPKEKHQGSYIGIGPNVGLRIDKRESLDYALEQCGVQRRKDRPVNPEFEKMLDEWFYSDNWIV